MFEVDGRSPWDISGLTPVSMLREKGQTAFGELMRVGLLREWVRYSRNAPPEPTGEYFIETGPYYTPAAGGGWHSAAFITGIRSADPWLHDCELQVWSHVAPHQAADLHIVAKRYIEFADWLRTEN